MGGERPEFAFVVATPKVTEFTYNVKAIHDDEIGLLECSDLSEFTVVTPEDYQNWNATTKASLNNIMNSSVKKVLGVDKRRRLGWKPSHDMQRRREGFHHLFNPSIQESTRCQES